MPSLIREERLWGEGQDNGPFRNAVGDSEAEHQRLGKEICPK